MKMRDKYLHTNCLAALANMSGQFRSLHPYVAQRLVSLFETLAKKHARLEQKLCHPHELDAAASVAAQATVVTVVPSPGGEEVIDMLGEGAPAEDMVSIFFKFICKRIFFDTKCNRCKTLVFWRKCCEWCWKS